PNKEKNTDSDNKIIKDDLKDTDLKRKKFDYDPDFGPDTLPKLHDQGRKLTLEKRKFKKFSLETPIGKVPEFSVKGFDEFNHRNYMQDVVWKVGNLWFYKYAPTSQIMFGTMRASSPIVIGFDVDNKGKIINNRFIKMGDIKSQNDAVKLTFSKIKLKNPPKGLIYRNLRITFTIYPPVKGKNVNELILIGRVYLEGEVSLPED
ncbi:MAG: hypothetical protein OEV44_14635, partial [Spirochaetota bacterium]|nr:hypothetical protein [Spirochaetota bacterium]